MSLLEPPPEPLAFASFADLERVALACTKCPLADDPHPGGVRRRRPACRADVRGRGPGRAGRPRRHSVRRPRRAPAHEPDRGHRSRSRLRLHRQRREVPATGQPRSAAARDRQLPPVSRGPDRVHRPLRRRDARKLRDEVAARHQGRHHEAARPGVSLPKPRRAHPHAPPGGRAPKRWCCARASTGRLRPRETHARRRSRDDDHFVCTYPLVGGDARAGGAGRYDPASG